MSAAPSTWPRSTRLAGSVVAFEPPTFITRGRVRYSRTRFSTLSGMVAENSSVCRRCGSRLMMVAISS